MDVQTSSACPEPYLGFIRDQVSRSCRGWPNIFTAESAFKRQLLLCLGDQNQETKQLWIVQCRKGNKLETDKKIHQAMMASINRNSFAANYVSAAINVINYVKILRNPVKMELMLSTFPLAMEPVFKFPRQCPMHAFHCDGHDDVGFI